MSTSTPQDTIEGVAIIGMAGRFPGASNVEEFWQNLRDGVESISFFTEQELADIDPALLKNPNYVKAAGVVKDVECFDAAFFNFTPREAELMDPQHRLFLECGWQALETAGYDSETYRGLIGIYAGMGMSKYLLYNLLPNRKLVESAGPLQLKILNDKDFLTPLVSYSMNFRGPCVTIQTACSTSLVAVAVACQSLLNYQCDIALAGGVAIEVPVKSGYLHVEGVTAPDGHCRAFDAEAQGTVGGSGLGVVVLKRLADAIADGDTIYAVIKGAATNNDGAVKVGFTATSVDGQIDVIAMAQAIASVKPETVSYVEAHGTATPLGDPIEVAALSQVFSADTNRKNFCAIGSVKTNIGHLDAAAGVASLIKTVLALKEKQIPPSLHFTAPNPRIDFANSAFYVNHKLSEWQTNEMPRRAGVSSFSLGGVNAHVVLEEGPTPITTSPSRSHQLMILSAKTATALETATSNLVDYLRRHPEQNLADIAYTYQVGRRSFRHRRMLVCRDSADALASFESLDPKRVLNSISDEQNRPVTFMFPGLGNQYVNMGLELYRNEPVFRQEVDRCCELLKPHLGMDLREVLYPADSEPSNQKAQTRDSGESSGIDLRKMLQRDTSESAATQRLNETAVAQPALFVIEYALAQWWLSCGVRPQALMGYSIGEHVAACLAGVFSLPDALLIVAERARLIQTLPAGAMLAVPLSEKEVQPLLHDHLSLSAVNGPSVCVLSGTAAAIDELQAKLTKKGVACRRPQTTHAFHSRMMEPIADELTALIKTVELKAPQIPYISNVTGTWITNEQATDPAYWSRHLCQPVRFADGLRELWKTPDRILLEIGPGQALGAWALQHPDRDAEDCVVLYSLPHSYDQQSEIACLLGSLGKLWLAGLPVDWSRLSAAERRQRIALPTYPFERLRYWVDPPKNSGSSEEKSRDLNRKAEVADWFYFPSWKQATPLPLFSSGEVAAQKRNWLVFTDECGVGIELVRRLEADGCEVVTVECGETFGQTGERSYVLNPRDATHYRNLFEELFASSRIPHAIAHLWSVTPATAITSRFEFADQCQYAGFYSLLFLAQVLGEHNFTDDLSLGVISNGLHQVSGEDLTMPEKATLIGPCRVIPREFPNISCRSIDLNLPVGRFQIKRLIDYLIAELNTASPEEIVAHRGHHRWIQTFEASNLFGADANQTRLRDEGVYLITGGAGGIGIVLAEHLARSVRAKLVLVGRSALPPRTEWLQWLAEHDDSDVVCRKIRAMQAIEELGAEVLYLTADVTDIAQAQEVVTATLERFGALNGVVHAAGVLPGGIMQLKTEEIAASVLAPKVQGTLVLDHVLGDIELDFFILCSSLTSILGSFGMVDHCAANAFLDAFAQHDAAVSGRRTISVNWDTWLEVGQAAAAAAANPQSTIRPLTNGEEVEHPLHDRRLSASPDEEIYATEFTTSRHWILAEHRIKGDGMIPGTAYLEMARAAFNERAAGQTIHIEKALFLTPLIVADGERKEARTSIKRDGTGFEFQILSRLHTDQANGPTSQLHARGKIAANHYEAPNVFDLGSIRARCNGRELTFDQNGNGSARPGPSNPNEMYMAFGPRWRNLLKRVHVGEDEWLALLELPDEFTEDLKQFTMHPALLDAATGVVQLAANGTYLPMGYDSLKVKGPFPQRIFSHIKYRDNGPDQDLLTCDVTIMDETGVSVVEIEGYTLKKLEDATIKALTSLDHTTDELRSRERADVNQRTSTPNGEKGNLQLNDGLLPAEGAEVFNRILTGQVAQPQVVISTRDLYAAKEWVASLTKANLMKEASRLHANGVRYPRPNLQNTYVEPRSELEQGLADIWQELLGIEQVGCFDNFFELGGDSLLATQLISRLGEVFNVDLPLRTLFQSPTVADLAVEVVQKQVDEAGDDILKQLLTEMKDWPEEEAPQLLLAEQ